MPTLALSSWTTVATVLVVVSALAIVVIVVAPWRTVREEGPLDDTAETRLLMGEDFAEVAAEDEDDTEDEAEPQQSGPAA